MYGFKVEVSVLPIGLAISCSAHYPGSVSDIEIMKEMHEWHVKASRKSNAENDVTDIGILSEEYPDSWAVLVDKGYQGSMEFLRTVHPKKKPQNGILSMEDEAYNKKVSSDRIIVENYFGRLCSLWAIAATKYRWAESNYDKLFRLCVALTNQHIRWHPLRQEDHATFQRYKNRQYSIGAEIARKRKRIQERYKARRKARLSVLLHGEIAPRQPSEDDDEF